MELSKYPLQVIRDVKALEEEFESIINKRDLENFFDSEIFTNNLFIVRGRGDFEKYNFFVTELVSKEYYEVISNPSDGYSLESGATWVDTKGIVKRLIQWIDLVTEATNIMYDFENSKSVKEDKVKENIKLATCKNLIQNIQLKNFQFIKQVELNNLSNKKEIYILGENGDGKTVLLQALMLAFKEHFVKNIARKSLVGEFLDFEKDFEKASYEIELDDKTILSKTNMSYHSDVYAYGTHRGNILSETEDEYGFMTLFSPRYHLRNPVDWLVEMRGKELELKVQNESKDQKNNEKQNILTLEIAKSLLEDIINSGENPKDIHIEVDLSSKEKVVFKERDTKIKFEHLSEGYRSVFIWVADLVSRLAESQPTVKQIQDFKGIVLVDEINLHLHPKWEIQIVQKLRSWFPNIQFFFTTHSPICVLGASEDAVFYRLYKEEGIAKLSEQINYSQIKEMTANQIVTSMLFDLETPFMRHTDSSEIDTSEDYLYNRIHKKISQRLAERKKEGEVYFSDEEINAMIDEALDSEIENDEIE
ncbi:AAA family ATPase [Bernardetia sp. MNP-M8]|uniref:AAA family ATPase n=1 Tax=Bernardetia sp. MNP-M8 TaxID=3127470 RepID=UPI0030D3304F